MHRAVAWAATAGITQFVDLGTGIPTEPTAHRLARQIHPGARVVGVDIDPVVLAHDHAWLGGMPIVEGDVRRVDELIGALSRRVDWDKPVAVLLVAVLHLLGDADNPAGVVAAFTERMAPGSVVALSHLSRTGADADTVAQVEAVSGRAGAPVVLRTHEQIMTVRAAGAGCSWGGAGAALAGATGAAPLRPGAGRDRTRPRGSPVPLHGVGGADVRVSGKGQWHGGHAVTLDSPIEDLGLSQHALRPLLNHWRGLNRAPTVGDLADLVKAGRLGEVRQIGGLRAAEITAALEAAGLVRDPRRSIRG